MKEKFRLLLHRLHGYEKKWQVVVVILLGSIMTLSHVIKQEDIPLDLRLFIATAEGVSENIDYIIDGTSAEQTDLAMSGTVNYFGRLIRYADRVRVLCEGETDEFITFQLKLEQDYDQIRLIAEKYISEGQITDKDRQFLEYVKDSIDSLISDMRQRNGMFIK